MEVKAGDVVLCEFYFSDLKASKNRPVLILKDNLPYDDFIGVPLSSQTRNMHQDEVGIDNTAFSRGDIPKSSKLMLRKTLLVSKTVVIKKYGSLSEESFKNYHQLFCKFFQCLKS